MYWVDPKDRLGPLLRWHGRNVLEEAAFDRHMYATTLARNLAARLQKSERVAPAAADQGEPKPLLLEMAEPANVLAPRPIKGSRFAHRPLDPAFARAEPLKAEDVVIFIGQIADIAEAKGNTFVLLRVYGYEQYIVIAATGRCGGKRGEYRLAAGIVSDTKQVVPCVTAVALLALRDVNPDFRPSSGPPSAATTTAPGATVTVGAANEEAEKQLKLATMYEHNGMHAKAGEILRDIVKRFPKTDAATKAKEMLDKLGEKE